MSLIYHVRSGLMIPDYWHPRLEIQTDFDSGKIGLYPFSMAAKAHWAGRTQDGVPLLEQPGGQAGVFPVMVALYGLGSYDAWVLSHKSRYEAQMWAAAHWLEKHAAPLGPGIGWRHDKNMPIFNLTAPWYSGIVQGLALSLFTRAHQIERGEQWRDMARRTWLGFHCPIHEGGFSRAVPEGTIYEEYPIDNVHCVFNGMCHSLIGLWEAATSGLLPEAENDFRRGLNALHARVHRFDHQSWSLYCLSPCLDKPFLASPYYHRANGLLATIIGQMAEEPEFCTYGRRWLQSGRSFPLRIRKSVRILLDRVAYTRHHQKQVAGAAAAAAQRVGT